MTGRNDGFMGDFNWRLGTSINIMARAASSIGKLGDLEIIVSDWNSDIPLHKVIQLVPEAKAVTRFIPVPREVAEPAQKDTHFPDSIVLNTGIRRATGEFISQTGSDVVFTAASLNALFSVLEGRLGDLPLKKAFLSGGRRHIPNSIVNRRLPLQEFEDYLNRNAAYFPEERGGAGHGAPTNMMLMHRDLWHSSRGFDERFIYWGFNDIDLALRITAQHDFIQLEHFGVNSLHMEHWTKARDYTPGKMFRKLNPVNNLTPEFAPNPSNWGLGDFDLPLLPGEAIEPEETQIDESLPWHGLLREIGNQILRPEIQNAVRETLSQFGNLPVPATEHPALISLAWCAANCKPRLFVEIGHRYPHATAIVSRISPGTEFQLVADFERRQEDDHIFYGGEGNSLIFYLSNCMKQFGHWAYTQYIQQEQKIDGQFISKDINLKGPIDLALIRLNDDRFVPSLIKTCHFLRKNGAIILTAKTKALFQKGLSTISDNCQSLEKILFDDGLNGLFLYSLPPKHPGRAVSGEGR